MHRDPTGGTRADDYQWLTDRDDPEVIAYLEAENAYAEAVLAPLAPLEDQLFAEITGRMEKDDASVPVRRRGHLYYTRFEGDSEYPLYCRRALGEGAPEQVMLDANELARGQSYLAVTGVAVSADEDVLAFGADTVGRRFYTLRFKSLTSGELLPDTIPDTTGNLAWAEDGRTVLYTRQDPVTLREDRVFRHVLGTDPASDALVYEEKDPEFSVSVRKTRSRRYLLIESDQTLSTETRYLDAARPEEEPRVLLARERDHEYHVDHLGDSFYVRTNWQAPGFRLMRAPVARIGEGRAGWEQVIPARRDVLLEDLAVFDGFLALSERSAAQARLRVLPWGSGGAAGAPRPSSSLAEHEIAFDEPVYDVYLGENPEVDSTTLRFGYSSMTTPDSVYDYDPATRERELRKRDRVVGDFDPARYRSERLWATATDGARVPISLVYRPDLRREGGNPLLLYGYGSYGLSTDPDFDSNRLSLLDRGFVYAIAHVRGGQEMGRAWYEDGKLQHKRNTFTDFIACAEHLAATGWADRDRVFAMGGSAGGLLIGAVINLRPDLFRGAVARVPFVDVVTTMLDDSIPLTTAEFDEWGNPERSPDYETMLSYSPYDNVAAGDYPALLVTTGLHDSQVQYFEPAKWVAKLRATRTDERPLLLITHMDAGHGGVSGRFRQRRETAMIYAFLVDLAARP